MKVTSTTFILFVAYLSLTAQESLSLGQAVETAIVNAYTVKIANKNIEIAELNNNWGEAGRYPTVSAGLNNANNYSNINNPTSFLNGAELTSSNWNLSLDVQWVLFDGGRVRATKNRLSVLAEQAGADAKVIADNITREVSRAYFNALVQEKRLAMQGDALRFSRDKISYIEARREYGQATEFDLLQIRDAYLNDSIQWLLQETNYRNALQNLALAMGLEPGDELKLSLSDTLNYQLIEYEFEQLKTELLASNRQIQAERIKIQLAEAEIELQKANLYPRITLGGNLSEQFVFSQIKGKQPMISDQWQGGSTFSGAINFGINYTIYNGGRFRRAVESSKLRQQIARFSILDMERRLSQQLQVALNLYQNQKAILSLSQEMLRNAERNLLIAEERFRAGTLNYFDFRSIQISHLRSINALQDAFLNAKNTEFDLLLLSGLLLRAVD